MTPDPQNLEQTLALTNIVIAWVCAINIPLSLLIIRMLWGFNNRLTILEVQARQDGDTSPYRRRYRAKKETEE